MNAKRRLRILIADDDADTADFVAAVLETLGWGVVRARGQRDALCKLEENRIDLLLTDLFCSRIEDARSSISELVTRAHPAPTGVITAWPVRREDLPKGVRFVLRKPCDPTELISEAAEALATDLPPSDEATSELVHAYFRHMGSGDWTRFGQLLAHDVTFEFPGAPPERSRAEGRTATVALIQSSLALMPEARFEEVRVYGLGSAVAARYQITWARADGTRASHSSAVFLSIRSGEVRHIRMHVDRPRLVARLDP